MSNQRIIALTMRNNQLSGQEHFDDIKFMIKNHPSLTVIDFSNTETNMSKNKLKNQGVQAIVEGILESQDHSMIQEINLGYNYLTVDCLPVLARLSNPEFVQIHTLHLSFNELGPEVFLHLAPIMGTVINLNLANTKLGNQSMADLNEIFRTTDMSLKTLDLHTNLITSEGFNHLGRCLKSNNKVQHLNLSKNNIANDIN